MILNTLNYTNTWNQNTPPLIQYWCKNNKHCTEGGSSIFIHPLPWFLHISLTNSFQVGKESTFRKVDSIIKENNQIMYLIAKVVQICFANAKKYNLDFRGITLAGPNGEGEGGTGFNTSGGAGTSAQQDATFGSSRRGGAPTANQGSKRTRVSFLLY